MNGSLEIVRLTPTRRIPSSFHLKPADFMDLINNFDNELMIFKISMHSKIDEGNIFQIKTNDSLSFQLFKESLRISKAA